MLGLVTAEVAASVDDDLVPLHEVLSDRIGGDQVRIVSWDDPAVDWSAFDAVIIRSTWGYTDRLPEFLDWVGRVDAVTTLVNSSGVVRWNADKRYLADLADAGIAITPTTFVAPGEAPPTPSGLHVVKPTVGAGAKGARRCEGEQIAEHVARLHAAGATAMVQPYLDRLDDLGETALCFVAAPDARDGVVLSHSFRKGAILTSDHVATNGLFADEQIDSRTAAPAEIELAQRVLDSSVVRQAGPIMFARVDVAPHRSADGTDAPVLMELELIEPSFFFSTSSGSVELFAEALIGWLERRDGDC